MARLRGRGKSGHGQRGGCPKRQQGGGVPSPPSIVSLSLFGVSSYDRPTRTAPAVRGKTGATPPFVPLARHGEWGGVSHGVRHRVSPPLAFGGGRSRLYVSLREGSPARTRAGRRAATNGAMLDRLIRAFLVVVGVSVASAWTWPGAFPAADPVAVLVRYHTPTRVSRRRRVVLRPRPAWPCSWPGTCSSAHRGSGSPGWASV